MQQDFKRQYQGVNIYISSPNSEILNKMTVQCDVLLVIALSKSLIIPPVNVSISVVLKVTLNYLEIIP
jgi:hypothetical protein